MSPTISWGTVHVAVRCLNYHRISWSLKTTRFGIYVAISLWKITKRHDSTAVVSPVKFQSYRAALNSLKISQYLAGNIDVMSLTHWGQGKMATVFQTTFFECIFLSENVTISIKISLKFVPNVSDNKPTLVQIGSNICVTQPHWVKVNRGPGDICSHTNFVIDYHNLTT